MANLDLWVSLTYSGLPIKLDEWIRHDEYWQEAISQSVNDLVEARNKAAQEERDKMLKAVNESKQPEHYVSPFANSGTRPTFNMS